ncbi:hypothetical protein V8F06_006875 [Rhypophila decipiens]
MGFHIRSFASGFFFSSLSLADLLFSPFLLFLAGNHKNISTTQYRQSTQREIDNSNMEGKRKRKMRRELILVHLLYLGLDLDQAFHLFFYTFSCIVGLLPSFGLTIFISFCSVSICPLLFRYLGTYLLTWVSVLIIHRIHLSILALLLVVPLCICCCEMRWLRKTVCDN